MKKFVTFLISAILIITSVNLYAQTEMNNPKAGKLMNFTNNVNFNEEDGCIFRFVLKDLAGFGWGDEKGITVTVDGVDYGTQRLPWGTSSAEETLLLPSGEVHFFWEGDVFSATRHYFEIYNSFNELIYTSPEMIPDWLFFTYQNECPECLLLTDFEGAYIPEAKQINLSWTAPESVD